MTKKRIFLYVILYMCTHYILNAQSYDEVQNQIIVEENFKLSALIDSDSISSNNSLKVAQQILKIADSTNSLSLKIRAHYTLSIIYTHREQKNEQFFHIRSAYDLLTAKKYYSAVGFSVISYYGYYAVSVGQKSLPLTCTQSAHI